eukprot:1178448-Prorocentrum_minimum.AAC.1
MPSARGGRGWGGSGQICFGLVGRVVVEGGGRPEEHGAVALRLASCRVTCVRLVRRENIPALRASDWLS